MYYINQKEAGIAVFIWDRVYLRVIEIIRNLKEHNDKVANYK